MVGFDNGTETERTLDNTPVGIITSALTGDLDLAAARPLPENKAICFRSEEKGGPFDIEAGLAQAMLKAPINPNGRSNSEVVRPYVNGLDITRRPQNIWIIDFGIDMSQEAASLYEMPFEYVQQKVKPVRDKVRNAKERRYWWLHRRPAPEMRQAVEGLGRFICTPRVSKYRLFVWLEGGTIPDSATVVFARDDDYFFGVLHSRAHEKWALRMGTFLGAGNDPRYTPTTCFETFPFPEPTKEQRMKISAAAKHLDDLRRNWLNPEGLDEADLKKRTLTNLYNTRPSWLAFAHDRLDQAVFAAYGWAEAPDELSEEEMLGKLLRLNAQRAEASV